MIASLFPNMRIKILTIDDSPHTIFQVLDRFSLIFFILFTSHNYILHSLYRGGSKALYNYLLIMLYYSLIGFVFSCY